MLNIGILGLGVMGRSLAQNFERSGDIQLFDSLLAAPIPFYGHCA